MKTITYMKQITFACTILLSIVFTGCKQSDSWENLSYPEITVFAEDTESEGAKLFNELVSNPDSLFNECIFKVCTTLYHDPAEVPNKKIFEFHLRNTDGVAATGGDSITIDMFLSTNYISGFYNSHNKDKKETLAEITGVLIHELTHAYQHSPKGAGGYVGGSEHFSCIEGMADATRFLTGYISPDFQKPGGHWNDGYKITGFFIAWMTKQDPDFLYEFNQSALTITPWSWDKAMNQLMGKPVADLWIAYQQEINPNQEEPTANFSSDNTNALTDQRVSFRDQSEGDPFEWHWTFEGGVPNSSDARNPKVIYKQEGKYPVKLEVRSAYGNNSIVKDSYIIVKKNPSGTLFSELENKTEAQFNDSPRGEGIDKLFDNVSTSKYLTYNPSAWINFKLKSEEKYKLNKYCIVSANDAPQRDPKNIVIKGSNDGDNWDIIDQQNNIDFKRRHESIEFPVATKKAYSQFKIELSNHRGPILQVADILLFGDISK